MPGVHSTKFKHEPLCNSITADTTVAANSQLSLVEPVDSPVSAAATATETGQQPISCREEEQNDEEFLQDLD